MRKYLSLFLLLSLSSLFSQQKIFLSPGHYNLKKFKTVEQSFKPPEGYRRVKTDPKSFAAYLRNLPVLSDSIPVLDYNGHIRVKKSDSTLAGVIPVDINNRRLWQCMDILQVFHMDYLFGQMRGNEIVYPLPDGTRLSWLEWQQGVRAVFKESNFIKAKNAHPFPNAINYGRYSNMIFEHSGTQTFWHYYMDIDTMEIFPGDFIVKKGKKGHAVLIVDLASNKRGKKIALIGQGDTPACQFYLLKKSDGNAWFKIENDAPGLPIKKKMYWQGLRRF